MNAIRERASVTAGQLTDAVACAAAGVRVRRVPWAHPRSSSRAFVSERHEEAYGARPEQAGFSYSHC